MNPEIYEANDRLEGQHWWFVGRRRIIQEVLERHLTPESNRSILDVGCGTGGMFPMLSAFGEVSGVEASADARARAQAKFPDAKIEACWLPTQLPEGQWKVVTAFDVLEHLDEPEASLVALRERLSPGGQLVVTVPAYQALWSKHDEVHHHKRRYSKALLTRQLEQAGFTLQYLSFFNTLLFPAVAAARGLERVLPSRQKRAGENLKATWAPLNAVLTACFGAEHLAVGRGRLPFGVSMIAVAQR